jgi:hypothetical protein
MHTLSLSLSLSLPHTHTHTHTHANSHLSNDLEQASKLLTQECLVVREERTPDVLVVKPSYVLKEQQVGLI